MTSDIDEQPRTLELMKRRTPVKLEGPNICSASPAGDPLTRATTSSDDGSIASSPLRQELGAPGKLPDTYTGWSGLSDDPAQNFHHFAGHIHHPRCHIPAAGVDHLVAPAARALIL